MSKCVGILFFYFIFRVCSTITKNNGNGNNHRSAGNGKTTTKKKVFDLKLKHAKDFFSAAALVEWH